MGAVCYQPKPHSISKEEVLQALHQQHLKDTITEYDSKTLKTEEKEAVLSFTNLT